MHGGSPPPDPDHDGMPDEWELNHSLNPFDPRDGRLDSNGDGYTNLERYLNDLCDMSGENPEPRVRGRE